MPPVNPLSPHSSRGDSPQHPTGNNYQQSYVQQQHSSATINCLPALDVKVLQKLQEDRLRMEAEYFREKAGFYRMQKYLTALQAKKVRVEIERMHQEEATVVTTADLNGAYAVEVAIPEHHITTQ